MKSSAAVKTQLDEMVSNEMGKEYDQVARQELNELYDNWDNTQRFEQKVEGIASQLEELARSVRKELIRAELDGSSVSAMDVSIEIQHQIIWVLANLSLEDLTRRALLVK